MKWYKKKNAIILSVLILLNCSTIPVFAQNTQLSKSEKITNPRFESVAKLSEIALVDNGNSENRVKELTSKRTKNSKQFLLADGSYQAEIYQSNIHYEDEKGNYQDINPQFIDKTDVVALKSTYSKDFARKFNSKSKEYGKGIKREVSNYTATEVPFNLEVHKKIAEGYSIEKDGNEICITPLNVSKSSTAKLDKSNGQKLTYSNVWKNTDLELVVTPVGIKENIVLENSDSPKKLSFEISNKITDPSKKGNLSFLPMWLIDKNGTYRDVQVKERTEASRTYMDIEWDSKNLVYPVTIDPSIAAGIQTSVVVNVNSGISPVFLQVGGTQGPSGVPQMSHVSTTQSYMLYSLPQLPSEVIFQSARLSLYYSQYVQSPSSYNPYPTLDLHPYYVDNDINGASFAWSNKPAISTNISGQLLHINLLSPANTLYESNITSLVSTAYSKQKNKLTVALVSDAHNLYQTDVRAFFGNGYMASQSKITVNYTTDAIPPTVPTELVASKASSISCTLSWKPSTDNEGVSFYRIYDGATPLNSTGGSSLTLTNLLIGHLYEFRVTAVDINDNESAPSNIQYFYVGKYTYFYDLKGRIDYILLADGRGIKYIYDNNGNLLNKKLMQN